MIEEFYLKINGDYSKAISRMQNDDRIKKYLGFFLMDDSYQNLENAIQNKETENAFRAAHTLKGVCQNMAFTDFSVVVEKITEELRAGDLNTAINTFAEVKEKYQILINEIKKVI